MRTNILNVGGRLKMERMLLRLSFQCLASRQTSVAAEEDLGQWR